MNENFLDRFFNYLPWVTLLILIFYFLAELFLNPYPGFIYTNRTYEITDIYSSFDALQIGDVLVRVADHEMATFHENPREEFLKGFQVGDQFDLLVLRDGQELIIPWSYVGITPEAVIEIFTNFQGLTFLYWVVGFLTFVLIRPRDSLWKLLIAFNFVTALWFITGSTSKYHYFLTPLVFRAALWLAVPIYVHLHWSFPKPLTSLSGKLWALIYSTFALIALSQFFFFLPEVVHLSAFSMAIVASLVLVILHYILRSTERRAIRVLLWAMAFSFLPVLSLVLATIFDLATGILAGALLALPIMPFAYFYAIFRHRLGGLELRANRIISVYLFIFLAVTIISFITPILLTRLDFPGSSTAIAVSVALLTAILAVSGFRRFERFVEERILGMPLPPENLMHEYAREITGSLNRTSLDQVLSETILPTMLIRQSCLLYRDKQADWRRISSIGLQDNYEVHISQIPALLEQTGRYLPIRTEEKNAAPLDWVRLIIPLDIEEEVIGLWLFGRRDPEDFYSQRDIAFLQTLANQTAIALANISLSLDLRALYMANVKRQEDEKENIARELHDDVLNELAVLSMKMDGNVSNEFQRDYQNLTDRIRSTVQDLRPPMLNHGLHTALEELGQTLNKRTNHSTEIEISIPYSAYRFDRLVEAHLFRIVQQACENALRHADAQHIIVSGSISDEVVELEVSDNGKGFELGSQLNLAGLLAEKHYGIASMVERAELVDAHLRFASSPSTGTSITVFWIPS